jgi:hypothetical protein
MTVNAMTSFDSSIPCRDVTVPMHVVLRITTHGTHVDPFVVRLVKRRAEILMIFV